MADHHSRREAVSAKGNLAFSKVQLSLGRRPENAGPLVVKFAFASRDHDRGQRVADHVQGDTTEPWECSLAWASSITTNKPDEPRVF